MEIDPPISIIKFSKTDRDELIEEIGEVFGKLQHALSADSFAILIDNDANYYSSIRYFFDTIEKTSTVTPVFRRVLWDINSFLVFCSSLVETFELSEDEYIPEDLIENIEALRKLGSDLFVDTNRIEMNMVLCFDYMKMKIQSLNNQNVDLETAFGGEAFPRKVKIKLGNINNLIQANKYRLQIYSSFRNNISHILSPL